MADGILTPCNVARSWHWFRQVTAPCNVACGSESWQWIQQVAAPCNVIRGSGMTCYWICPMAAPCNVTRSSGIMTLNSPGGSILQCGRWLYMGWHAMEFAQTSAILEFYTWFRVWPYHHNWHIVILLLVSISTHHRSRHVIMHQSAKFYPNRTTLSRKNWRHVDFQDGGPQPSWILGVP